MLEILPIPQIPAELQIAAKSGKLIPFIGAGASRLAGCLSWGDFADGAIKSFVNKGKFNLSQFEQIKHLSPRVKLSIALSLEENHGPIDFNELLHPKNNPARTVGEGLYGNLSKLAKTFVTTNYDRWLDNEITAPAFDVATLADASKGNITNPRRVIYKVDDLTHDNLTPGTVVHLHGIVSVPDSMVLTTRHYVTHYANDRNRTDPNSENRVLTFLENLFKFKNVLFIGYGLEELEILEYVILKAKRAHDGAGRESKHFILQGFFSHEQELASALESYYLRDCGIQLIPFSRDKKDWMQLIDVIEYLAQTIPVSPPLIIQEFQEMEGLLDE